MQFNLVLIAVVWCGRNIYHSVFKCGDPTCFGISEDVLAAIGELSCLLHSGSSLLECLRVCTSLTCCHCETIGTVTLLYYIQPYNGALGMTCIVLITTHSYVQYTLSVDLEWYNYTYIIM